MREFTQGSDGVFRGASVSDDRFYRYRLRRRWAPATEALTFVMLNPSTADGTDDDPTIRRCMGFARAAGYGGIQVINLYAYRATDPTVLRYVSDPIGPKNDEVLLDVLVRSQPTIVAWGAHKLPGIADRIAFVKRWANPERTWSLGLTKGGQPRHPLYLPTDSPWTPWPTQ